MTEFDLQHLLESMEERIRADIKTVGDAAIANSVRAQTVADAALLANAKVEGRVSFLEEKAAWVAKGVATLFLAACAFTWHVVSGQK